MKPVLTSMMMLALLLTFGSLHAQTNVKLRLFDNFSSKINCSTADLDKVFTSTVGDVISLPFQGNNFSGTILSSTKRYENLTSVVIKLNNLDGTVFGISRITNKDKTTSYVGRIVNEKYADMYLLQRDVSGNYFLEKQKTEDMIQDQ